VTSVMAVSTNPDHESSLRVTAHGLGLYLLGDDLPQSLCEVARVAGSRYLVSLGLSVDPRSLLAAWPMRVALTPRFRTACTGSRRYPRLVCNASCSPGG
jgi:hypothetical protein